MVLKANRRDLGGSTVLIKDPKPDEYERPIDGIKVFSNLTTNPQTTTVVDMSMVKASMLLQYTEGSPWNVTYYHSISGSNDLNNFFDPITTVPLQQYEKIYNQVLNVKSPLSSQQNDDKSFTVSGDSNLLNSVVPSERDFFTAEINSNRLALFTITSVTRKGYDTIGTYEIEYQLLYTVDDVVAANIEACVVREFYYNASMLALGGSALLTPEENAVNTDINEALRHIEDTYKKFYYDADIGAITFRGLGPEYYDVFLNRTVKDLALHKGGRDLNIYRHPPYIVHDIITLWTILFNQDKYMLEVCVTDARYYTRHLFKSSHSRDTVGYSAVNWTVFFKETFIERPPVLYRHNNHLLFNHSPKLDCNDFNGRDMTFTCFTPTYASITGIIDKLPLFLPVSMSPYIFSCSFYKGGYKSVIEYLCHQMINKETIDVKSVLLLYRNIYKVPEDSRMYYIPIVYILLLYSR